MKQRLSTLFSTLMGGARGGLLFLALVATTALWAEDFEVNGIYYKILTDKTNEVEVTYRGSNFYDYTNEYSGSVTIPSTVTYNGTTYSVTSIGYAAFADCSSLTSITIPNSVTSIGDYAFYGCSGLTSITIPNSVTSIGYSAFSSCSALTSITIPNSVTSIGSGVFYYCSGLTSVVWNAKNCADFLYSSYAPFYEISSQITSFTFGDSVQHIPACLCYGMNNLTSITIPNSVTSIGYDAFDGCSGLTSVVWNAENYSAYSFNLFDDIRSQITSFTFGDSVKHILAYMCYGMNNLTSITIPNSVTTIGECAFYGCSALTSVTIPNGVMSIERETFRDCFSLTSITIGNSVTSIGYDAFYGCSSLTDITWNAISCGVFSGYLDPSFSPFYDICSNITSFTFGDDVEYIPSCLCFGMSQLTSLRIPNNVKVIANHAFYGCSGLTSVSLGSSVMSILAEAFSSCSGLTSITIPNSVTSIGNSAFYDCDGLTSVTIPNSVTTIGEYAFSGCSALTSIVVENGNSHYDSRANCNAIIETESNALILGCQNTIIPNGVTSIGSVAFYGCSGLTSITIPNSVTSIGNIAFSDCSSLTSVTLGSSVTSIGYEAFSGCSALISVTIPNGVTSIEWETFRDCSSLTSITIPNSVTSIGYEAFSGCSALTSITIPNSVTSIGEQAFAGCFALSSVTIPNGVTSIELGTFHSCFNLTSVAIPNSVTSIADYAFEDCSGLTSITIPNSVTTIGWGAFYGCPSLTSVVWNAENCADFSWEDGNDAPFYNIRSQITSFTFGDSVQHIPAYLCYEMDNLTSMNIPNSIMSIGDSAFIGCTNFKSITWNAKSCNDFSTPSASLFYDSRSQITSFAFGEEVEHIPAYLCDGMNNLTSITIGNSVTSIGNSAFSGCAGLREISLGSQVKTIGAEAFALCPRIYEVTCLAPEPPVAEESSFTNYDAYFHAPCDAQRYYSVDPVWKKFHNVECIVTENTVMDDITITPSDCEATVVWLSHEQAATYSLVITKQGETYCTLTFNKYGQLINIALAPARARAKQAAADYTEKGYSFTITGLDAATTYDYTFSVLNDAHETLDIQYGTFTTQSNTTTSVSDIHSPMANCQKTIRNGQLYIYHNGSAYTVMGQKVSENF